MLSILGSCHHEAMRTLAPDSKVGWERPVVKVYIHIQEADWSVRSRIPSDIDYLREKLHESNIGLDSEVFIDAQNYSHLDAGAKERSAAFTHLRSVGWSLSKGQGPIHVVYVRNLLNDKGEQAFRGLHVINNRDLCSVDQPCEVVFLTIDSRRSTLTHEIGHALGLDHVRDENNIMCSCVDRTDGPEFTRDQQWVMLWNAWSRVQVP